MTFQILTCVILFFCLLIVSLITYFAIEKKINYVVAIISWIVIIPIIILIWINRSTNDNNVPSLRNLFAYHRYQIQNN